MRDRDRERDRGTHYSHSDNHTETVSEERQAQTNKSGTQTLTGKNTLRHRDTKIQPKSHVITPSQF